MLQRSLPRAVRDHGGAVQLPAVRRAHGGRLRAVLTRTRKCSRRTFRERRTSNAPLDQSGVWRYRELFPFLDDYRHVVTLREGNTPLLDGPIAAKYGGLDRITFKHQGFNPTGSFKDNGMTCGASQARRLGMQRVACVSTGNTSASMAAYAAAAGLEALIFLPHGNISFGKLAQALEYGAKTLQVEANFDQILALVRVLAERLGIYLLNSMNPFRIEGQKAIMFEMLDQRDWRVPDWVVLPGGNLGNTSAFGKGLREAKAAGLIDKLPRLAVIQAEGSAPFYELWTREVGGKGGTLCPVTKPETLATAIRIGDPVSWPKALHEVRTSRRHGRKGQRAGDRGRQGADRTVRDRLRAGLGGDAGRHSQAHGARGDRSRRGRGRGADRQSIEGSRLHLSLSHRPARSARRSEDSADIREPGAGRAERSGQDRGVAAITPGCPCFYESRLCCGR